MYTKISDSQELLLEMDEEKTQLLTVEFSTNKSAVLHIITALK